MPFCINCKKEIKKEWQSCPFCGTPNVLSGEKAETDNKQKDSLDKRESDSGTIDPGTGIYGLDYDNLPSGTLIDGKYRIEEKLGKGGFGTVYKAWYDNMDEWRALKIISREHYDDKEIIRDLRTEAKKLNIVNHSNVVRFYDVHLDGEIKYFDMEYIDGGDLVDLKLSYPDKRVPEERVRELALQIAEGMIAIHQKNIIHKDIKPQNILLTEEGTVKIADFGIAEKFRNSRSRLKFASRAGTPAYMSPEHLIGEDVGREADIWSFGVMMYELLTGKQLYNGESQSDVLMQIERKKFKQIAGVSDVINSMLGKCLQYDYRNRFCSFEEVSDYLSGKIDIIDRLEHPKKRQKENTSKEEPVHTAVIDRQPGKRNVGLFILLFLLVIGGIGAFLVFYDGDGKVAVRDTSKVEVETGLGDRVDKVSVPNLRGLTIEQARSRINNAGLVLGQTTERRDNDNIGKVISSSPSSGEVNRGSRVDLVVGIADRVTVPNLRGLTIEQARTKISNAGLVVGQITERRDNDNLGKVISSSPSSGEVDRGSSFNLVVGIADRVPVPNLRGLSLEQARSRISSNGLVVGQTTERRDNDNIGKVISSSPSSGEVNRGSRVDLVVGIEDYRQVEMPSVLLGSWYTSDTNVWSYYIFYRDGNLTVRTGNKFYQVLEVFNRDSEFIVKATLDGSFYTFFFCIINDTRMRVNRTNSETWVPVGNFRVHYKR
jgi:serine/threonine protein kinase/beta-lactam-binding protein with PASTA domain